jgi:3-hydroxybutyrate dehydrogenase
MNHVFEGPGPNAGIQFVAPVEKCSADKWNAILAINLNASAHTVHWALPLMKTRLVLHHLD